jgi:hypothetical protein
MQLFPEMNPTDHRLPVELEAAADLIRATALTVAERVCQTLAAQSQSSSKTTDRNTMFAAQLALYRQLGPFRLNFRTRLDVLMIEAVTGRAEGRRQAQQDSWQTLTLVDDKEVEDRMLTDRLGQQIGHACEVELQELSGYVGRVTGLDAADDDRNPLKPAIIGQALFAAIETVTADPTERGMLTREFGVVMAQAMPACYAAIVVDLQSRGISPVNLQVRTVDGPGNQLPGLNSGYASLRDDLSSTRGPGSEFHSSAQGGLSTHRTTLGSRDTHFGSTGSRSDSGYGRSGPASGRGHDSPVQDAQLMTLLRRLTHLTSQSGDLTGMGGMPPPTVSRYASGPGSRGPSYIDPGPGGGYADDASAGLMAVNLIRAHREELMQASAGKLDHMVIDVVGSLFDQILSDTRVPPQMAREIARLQLPVLRVALVDSTFFSSRRHPVRRFVNRIASLACAFDDFDDGPGKEFVERVHALVQEIVDGDFDQVDLYAAKLAELESFITIQATSEVQDRGAVAVLETKESDLRTQQRYLIQLQGALAPISMPEFLRSFLCQVWSQALVQAARQQDADGEPTKRYRNVGRDLVMSVQPKGSPGMRKRFLMQLPTLMRDLNDGLKLIGWPEAAQKEFFAQLLPAHAGSLKMPAMTELDYNLLSKQLESIFNSGTPEKSDAGRSDSGMAMQLTSAEIEQRFSPEEAKQVGLIDEQAVDWAQPVASEPVAEAPAIESEPLNLGVDIPLDLVAADPTEATHGARLIDHLRIGVAYQMLLKDQWQKVRLTYMSPGRSFFVFTHGRNLQETISMTARMLSRMCEAERLRAVENNYLMERATSRARKQLAELTANSRQ